MTAIFLVIAIGFALDSTCKISDGQKMCEMRVLALMDAPANEIGDTLAGLAGGLAFLWLVVTVLLQGKELSAQRQELNLTRMEMCEQRKATQEMAMALTTQSGVLLDEQRRHAATDAEREFSSVLKNIEARCRIIAKTQKGPVFKVDDDPNSKVLDEVLVFREPIGQSGDEVISELNGHLLTFLIMLAYSQLHGVMK